MSEQLVVLYQEMADHTAPECAKSCGAPHSCCSPEYCGFAVSYAKEQWGLDLVPTGHPRLPMMGPTGCVAPPHVRPMCTFHTCDVNGFGFKPNDVPWTEKYFEIRERIDELEILRQYGESE